INNYKILEMLKNITGHIKGYLLILDRNNNVILSESNSFTLPAEKIDLLKNIFINESFDENRKWKDFDNKEISLIVDVSEETGLKYILALPRAQFLDQ